MQIAFCFGKELFLYDDKQEESISMKLMKCFFTGLLGASLLLTMGACTTDGAADTADTAAETTASASEAEDVKKPYNAGTFPKDATEVRYSDFGAVGDGVTDDQDAIRLAHTIANARNLPVRADEGKTYYINAAESTKTIEVETDTDWTGASFILDDRDISFDGHWAQHLPVFSVKPSLQRFDLKIDALSIGDTNIGVAPGQDCLVYIYCNSIKHYIRYGANADSGQSQTEILLVDAEGNIDPSTPVTWDYPTVDRAFAIPVNETPITIRGGDFLTLANEINPDRYITTARNIDIRRSNVTVDGVKHRIEQVKDYRSAYGGFFNVADCNNVTIRNCEIMCHRDVFFKNDAGQNVLLGSYEFLATCTNNLTYENCVQTNLFDENGKLISQGLMGTNYCRNISMIDCTVARFDAHCQVYNVTVRGCEMEHINLIGFGTALVEDTKIHDRYIFNLRADYGSMFAGEIILRNVSMVREGTQRLSLFEGAWQNHNFGYPVYLPQKITIDNLTAPEDAYITAFSAAFDSYEDVTKTTLKNGTENKNPLILPQSMEVLSNPAGTRFRAAAGALPFPDFTGVTADAEDGGSDGTVEIFSLGFEEDLRTVGDGFLPTINDIARDGGVGSAILYDGNEVHADMNLKQAAIDGTRALLWTGCGNPNGVSKTSNITLDVKPASGGQNMDAFVYADYRGRDFVISFDLRAAEHEPYKKTTTEVIRLTSFYSPTAKDGATVTYSELLLSMDCNSYALTVPSAAGRKKPQTDITVPTDRFMNIAVHVHPIENTYDLYIDGEMIAEDIVLLSKGEQKKIGTYDETGALVKSEKENPMEDFCISYARLANTNGWAIEGDLFFFDNVKMYYSDTYQK